jgi:uncharacterized membrane protein YkoI
MVKILNRSTLVLSTIIALLLASAQFVLADDAGASNVSNGDSASTSSESNTEGNEASNQGNSMTSIAASDFSTSMEDGSRTTSVDSKGMGGPLDNSVTGFPAAATEGGEFGYGSEARDTPSKSPDTGSASGNVGFEGSATEKQSESANREASDRGSNREKEVNNSTKAKKVAVYSKLPKKVIVIPVPRSDLRKDQDEALEAVSNGAVLPLKKVLRQITDKDMGKVIDVKIKETLLGIVYKVKIRTKRGEINW